MSADGSITLAVTPAMAERWRKHLRKSSNLSRGTSIMMRRIDDERLSKLVRIIEKITSQSPYFKVEDIKKLAQKEGIVFDFPLAFGLSSLREKRYIDKRGPSNTVWFKFNGRKE